MVDDVAVPGSTGRAETGFPDAHAAHNNAGSCGARPEIKTATVAGSGQLAQIEP
jgi:hypothetical protein